MILRPLFAVIGIVVLVLVARYCTCRKISA